MKHTACFAGIHRKRRHDEVTSLYVSDLQSCQVGQGKDVAITTTAQPTLCLLGHQAVTKLASGLDSMGPTSTKGFW